MVVNEATQLSKMKNILIISNFRRKKNDHEFEITAVFWLFLIVSILFTLVQFTDTLM